MIHNLCLKSGHGTRPAARGRGASCPLVALICLLKGGSLENAHLFLSNLKQIGPIWRIT